MSDVTEKLERLATLLEKGLLTRAQFDEERDRILQRSRVESGGTPPYGSGPGSTPPGLHPERIGLYEVLGTLGQGGMGVVYRARCTLDARRAEQGGDVALKVLNASLAGDASFRARFLSEADLGMKLQHPGIVRVLDAFEAGGTLAVAMELVEGETVQELVARSGPMPWARVQAGFGLLLDAVEYAHGRGVIHRDLKPDNVMVRSDGSWAVLDFGIAKQVGGRQRTMTGHGLGTPDYMAPEQARGASGVGPEADVYGLGMTLYRVLAGRLPWEEDASLEAVLTLKATGDIAPPSQWYPGIPAWVDAAVVAATRARPDVRPGSVAALREALSGKAAGSSPTPHSQPVLLKLAAPHAQVVVDLAGAPPRRERQASWKVLAMGTVAVVVTLGLSFALLSGGQEDLPAGQTPGGPAGERVVTAPGIAPGTRIVVGDPRRHVARPSSGPETSGVPKSEGDTTDPSGPSSSAGRTQGVVEMRAVEQVMWANRKALNYCSKMARLEDPDIDGILWLSLTLSADGRIRGAVVEPRSSIQSASLVDCLRRRLLRLEMPTPRGGDVTFSYPFEVSSQAQG